MYTHEPIPIFSFFLSPFYSEWVYKCIRFLWFIEDFLLTCNFAVDVAAVDFYSVPFLCLFSLVWYQPLNVKKCYVYRRIASNYFPNLWCARVFLGKAVTPSCASLSTSTRWKSLRFCFLFVARSSLRVQIYHRNLTRRVLLLPLHALRDNDAR